MLTKGTMMMDRVFLVQTQMPTGGIYKLHGATGSMTANDPDHKQVWTKKYCRGTAGRYATRICKHFRPQWHSRLGLKVSGCTPPMGSHNPNPHRIRIVAMQKVVVPQHQPLEISCTYCTKIIYKWWIQTDQPFLITCYQPPDRSKQGWNDQIAWTKRGMMVKTARPKVEWVTNWSTTSWGFNHTPIHGEKQEQACATRLRWANMAAGCGFMHTIDQFQKHQHQLGKIGVPSFPCIYINIFIQRERERFMNSILKP